MEGGSNTGLKEKFSLGLSVLADKTAVFRIAFKDNKNSEKSRLRFGEILLMEKVVSNAQLNEALDKQKKSNLRLGEQLVELHHADEESILTAVARYYEISAAALSADIESEILSKKLPLIKQILSSRFSIRFRLTVGIVLMVLGTIFSLSYIVLNQQAEELYQQTLKMGQVSLGYFSNNARVPLLNDNILSLNALIKQATQVEGLLYAIVVDLSDNIKAHTNTKQIGTKFEIFPQAGNMTNEGDFSYYNYTSKKGEKVLNLSTPVLFQKKTLGTIQVGVSLDFIEQKTEEAQNSIILFSVIILAIGLAVGYLLSRKFSSPIISLDRSARILAKGDLGHQIDVTGKDELGSLARSFDNMRESIKKKIEDLEILTDAYARFVPKEFLELLEKESIVTVGLGDNVQMSVSVLFSDIRSFTTISEGMTPQENFEFLNRYLAFMNPVIKENKGFIDKYIGDAIMALFPTNPDDSVKGAIGMCRALQELNIEREKARTFPIQVGIGINTGMLMLGTIGGEKRMEGTVISDAVNLASRIEGMTKMYGAELLISENTLTNLKDASAYNVREVDRVAVKGKTEPVTVYELFDGNPEEVRESKLMTLEMVKNGLEAYGEQSFKEAGKIFRECKKIAPEDKFIQLYVDRCKKMSKQPYIENWDRVIRLTSK